MNALCPPCHQHTRLLSLKKIHIHTTHSAFPFTHYCSVPSMTENTLTLLCLINDTVGALKCQRTQPPLSITTRQATIPANMNSIVWRYRSMHTLAFDPNSSRRTVPIKTSVKEDPLPHFASVDSALRQRNLHCTVLLVAHCTWIVFVFLGVCFIVVPSRVCSSLFYVLIYKRFDAASTAWP